MAQAIQNNNVLTLCGLGANGFGVEGAKALATALETNTTLTQLLIRQNKIADEGAIALANMLKVNYSLQHLDVRFNSLTEKGAAALNAALESNFVLSQLQLEEEGLQIERNQFLKRNQEIRAIPIMKAILERNASLVSELLKAGTDPDEGVYDIVSILFLKGSNQFRNLFMWPVPQDVWEL